MLGLDLHRNVVMLIVLGIYLVGGCFMDSLALLLLTLPIFYPVSQQLGFDPIWFGVLIVVAMEMALITPPVGVNLYVVHGLRGRGSMNEVIRGATPFVLAMTALIVLLLIFPEIALWLPAQFK